MAGPPKQFGRRGVNPPPIVTRAPGGLAGAPDPLSPRRLRTVVITLGALGATAIGVFALAEAANRARDCPRTDGAEPGSAACESSSSSSGGHGGGGGSPGHGSGFSSASGSSVSFGGFGGAGAAHGGGGE